ncbi:two pore potassium channel protein sup-9-like [Actinia tenebrosa]|uniref:Two pore potassium channel protein sup-9-like n=1 Tax=Actinia tenebrosa TaxID=6105 RepID=A0A6P8HDC7_ACTTE|nr:two pore potassium channel protein sup-9-like [Actinia tenebrosa]
MKPIYKKCFLRMLLFLVYGFLGAWLFSLIEERDEPYAVTSNRRLELRRKEMKNKYNLTNSTDFDKFVAIVSEASQLKKKMDWTVLNGCEFTYTAITTVGYGNITPQTILGQVLTIPYCTIGLPISMVALKTAGEVLAILMHNMAKILDKRVLRQKRPKQSIFKCFAMIISWIIVLVGILATAEMYLDGWTFHEGLYSWFITFTTIGLGDYVPFQNFKNQKAGQSAWALILFGATFTVPYIIGLCLVSCLLNLLVEHSESIKVSFCVICSSSVNNHEVEAAISNDVKLNSITCRRFSV